MAEIIDSKTIKTGTQKNKKLKKKEKKRNSCCDNPDFPLDNR